MRVHPRTNVVNRFALALTSRRWRDEARAFQYKGSTVKKQLGQPKTLIDTKDQYSGAEASAHPMGETSFVLKSFGFRVFSVFSGLNCRI